VTVVVCPKCLYEWDTESTALWVTCPSCMRKSIQAVMRIIHGGPVETLDQELQKILSPGQGCRWRSDPTYCDRFDPEQNYDECLKCEKLLGSLGEKQWTKFFNEQKALIAISKDRCTKPTKCAESEK